MPKIENLDGYRKRMLESPKDYKQQMLESMEDYRMRGAGDIPIGYEGYEKRYLPLDILKTHLHVIGLTGTGKSFFLELLMRELLYLEKGFCLIDPLGFLYDSTVNFIAHHPEFADRVVFFNAAEPSDYVVGYNPFHSGPHWPSLPEQVKSTMLSMLKVFETDPSIARTLRTTLANAIQPTIEAGLTPYELLYFVLQDRTMRDVILSHTQSDVVLDYWKKLIDKLSRTEWRHELGSFDHRIREFAANEMIRAVIAQTEKVINIPEIVESQKVVLVNLSRRGWLSEADAHIIGTFLVNEIYQYALKRQKKDADTKPFYVLIDEFQHFLTPDASMMLATCRQKGVHMVLAHQHLKQLISQHLDPPEAILDAVMAEARSKVIFATYPDDAGVLAKFFAPEWNLMEVKQELYKTTVLNYELEKHILHGGGESSSYTSTSGSGSGNTSGSGSGMTWSPGQTFMNRSLSNFESALSSWSDFSSSTEGRSEHSSWGEALVLRPILGKELASREFWSYQEQHFKQAAALMNLATQHAVIKLLNQPSMRVKIMTIVPYAEDQEKNAQAHDRSQEKHTDFYLPFQERLALQEARIQGMLEAPKEDPLVIEAVVVDQKEPDKAEIGSLFQELESEAPGADPKKQQKRKKKKKQ